LWPPPFGPPDARGPWVLGRSHSLPCYDVVLFPGLTRQLSGPLNFFLSFVIEANRYQRKISYNPSFPQMQWGRRGPACPLSPLVRSWHRPPVLSFVPPCQLDNASCRVLSAFFFPRFFTQRSIFQDLVFQVGRSSLPFDFGRLRESCGSTVQFEGCFPLRTFFFETPSLSLLPRKDLVLLVVGFSPRAPASNPTIGNPR